MCHSTLFTFDLMKVLESHIVPEGTLEIRLYDYLDGVFPVLPSRSAIKKAITRGKVLVNGEKSRTGTWIRPNDNIELLDLGSKLPKPYHIDLEVVFEDEYLMVVNKPGGIPVSGNQFKTIQNAIIENHNPSKEEDALEWPKPVHRLDSATSGLLIIAKTAKALMLLGKQFENNEIDKKYCAIVTGKTPEEGEIDFEIEGLKSLTEFKRVVTVRSLRNEFLSLVDLYPQTGRTHQLRIHLSKLGYPIMGDTLYGVEGKVFKGKGLFLCAIGLRFNHPITDEKIAIQINEPNKYNILLEREEKRWNRYQEEHN